MEDLFFLNLLFLLGILGLSSGRMSVVIDLTATGKYNLDPFSIRLLLASAPMLLGIG